MTKRNIISKSLVAAGFMALFAANQADAALVNFTVNGEITSATVANGFNLSVGDIVTASGQFDNSTITAGVIDFTSAVNNMNISFGNMIYTDSMDVLGGANMYFNADMFDGIDYISSNNNPEFRSWGTVDPLDDFTVTDFYGYELVAGDWIVSSYQVTAVPVPAAVWLFGSGIVFLTGIGRRQSQIKSV